MHRKALVVTLPLVALVFERQATAIAHPARQPLRCHVRIEDAVADLARGGEAGFFGADMGVAGEGGGVRHAVGGEAAGAAAGGGVEFVDEGLEAEEEDGEVSEEGEGDGARG